MRALFVRYMSYGLLVGIAAILTPVDAARSPGKPSGDSVTGRSHVVDGDTLAIGDVRIRLDGIDAPELGQTCQRAFVGSWACGTAAKTQLETLIAGRDVTCEDKGRDVYGRMLGHCLAGDVDLNDRMVRAGYAWAFLKYSRTYVAAEAEARAQRVGVWQGDAEPPWTFRERRWVAEAADAPQGCAIKGKITKNGHIYHTPWSPWYEASRVDERRGERWFCSEADAVAAGWRPAGAKW